MIRRSQSGMKIHNLTVIHRFSMQVFTTGCTCYVLMYILWWNCLQLRHCSSSLVKTTTSYLMCLACVCLCTCVQMHMIGFCLLLTLHVPLSLTYGECISVSCSGEGGLSAAYNCLQKTLITRRDLSTQITYTTLRAKTLTCGFPLNSVFHEIRMHTVNICAENQRGTHNTCWCVHKYRSKHHRTKLHVCTNTCTQTHTHTHTILASSHSSALHVQRLFLKYMPAPLSL